SSRPRIWAARRIVKTWLMAAMAQPAACRSGHFTASTWVLILSCDAGGQSRIPADEYGLRFQCRVDAKWQHRARRECSSFREHPRCGREHGYQPKHKAGECKPERLRERAELLPIARGENE